MFIYSIFKDRTPALLLPSIYFQPFKNLLESFERRLEQDQVLQITSFTN